MARNISNYQTINNKNYRIKKEEEFAMLLICLGVYLSSYVRVFRWLSYLLTGNATYGLLLVQLFWICPFFLYIIKHMRSRVTAKIIINMSLLTIFLFLNYTFFPNTNVYYEENFASLFNLVVRGVPCAVFLSKISNFNELIFRLKKFATVGFFIFVLSYLGGMSLFIGSMEWGITIIPVPLFYFAYIFNKKNITFQPVKIVEWVILISSIFFSLLAGRQWLIILTFSILFCILFETPVLKKKLTLIAGILISSVLFYMYMDSILVGTVNLLARLELQSRAIENLIDGTLLDTSNRSYIYELCKSIIEENGLKVSGIFADRYYLRGFRSDIAYAHNYIYEMLIDFGILFGGLIVVITFFMMGKKYIVCSKKYRFFYVIFIGFGFIRYLVSSSVFTEIRFLMLLGLIYNKSINSRSSGVFQPKKNDINN